MMREVTAVYLYRQVHLLAHDWKVQEKVAGTAPSGTTVYIRYGSSSWSPRAAASSAHPCVCPSASCAGCAALYCALPSALACQGAGTGPIRPQEGHWAVAPLGAVVPLAPRTPLGPLGPSGPSAVRGLFQRGVVGEEEWRVELCEALLTPLP